MNKALFTCKNCGEKFFEKDAIKVKRGYKDIISCPKCGTLRPVGTVAWDINNNIEDEDLDLKFKAGDRVFNKVTRKWVNIIEFDIETGLYIVRYDDGIQGRSLESEMIEGLVEEETKPLTYEETVEIIETMQGIGDSWECPQGYQFVDENGNVINATKIVLEKKGKKYPKTYEECKYILGITTPMVRPDYNGDLIVALQKLLICRDAYWKIAGEEMGLGKPWEPDWVNEEWPDMAYISYDGKSIDKENGFPCCNMILIFPTEEMRDDFYENFKELIEQCKELL